MPKEQIDKIVADKLAMVGLTQWAGKFGHELSGGMQQRVGLARAFATDADILLMDEPFSALDPLIRDKLQDELLLLQKDLKKTIIFVSHDLDEALKIGNRIAILEGGRIVQCGTAEDILLRPADAYVAEFVKHMNPLNVLRGGALMTPAAALRRSDNEVMLDRDGRVRVQLDSEDRPVGVTLDGNAGAIADRRPRDRRGGGAGRGRRYRRRADRLEDALGDRAAQSLGQSDRAGRRPRPHGGPVRRRRDLSRAAPAAPGGRGGMIASALRRGPRARPRFRSQPSMLYIHICLCAPSAPESSVQSRASAMPVIINSQEIHPFLPSLGSPLAIDRSRAERQDIRPLEIAIINLMADKISTERQLALWLGNTMLQVNLSFVATD